MSWITLNLGDKIPGCEHFRWTEVLWLPQWGVHVFPRENERDNLIKIAQKAELVREIAGCPLRVTSGLRPAAYNKQIGGAALSFHTKGLALDLVPRGDVSGYELREVLVDHLEELGLRMERLPKHAPWVHIDLGPVGRTGRYFYP